MRRYEQKIPPGYKDTEKDGTRQYGDLVIWNEILEHSRDTNRPVIFITSDTKEDWWWEHGQLTLGPRPELIQEMMAFAKTRFYMYNLERFLYQEQQYLDKTETSEIKKAAEEFKDIQNKKETQTLRFGYVAHFEKMMKDPAPYFAGLSKGLDQDGSSLRLRMDWLAQTPSSEAAKIPVSQWALALEDIYGRQCSAGEISVLEDAMEPKILAKVSEGARNCWEVAGALSVYVGVMELTKGIPKPI